MSTLPLTYTDLVANPDVDPFGAETTSDLQNLVQDILHVLQETPGSNPDDPDAGVGVSNYLSGTQDDFNAMVKLIEQQVLRDERVNTCTASVTSVENAFTVKVVVGVAEGVIPLEFGWQNGQFTNLTGVP